MKISDYGEFELIKRFSSQFESKSHRNILGIGDDCSIREFDEDLYQITTTDLLVEGVHFLKDKITPFELGVKSVEASISDIASMGGTADSMFLSVAIPSNFEISYLDEFFRGIKESSEHYNVELIGGDTSKSLNSFFINVLIQGFVEKERVKLRKGARSEDVICVSGNLGDSLMGLKIILNEQDSNNNQYFVERHNRPKAELSKARFLSEFQDVHSMIDISDGLASDLGHICEKSDLGAIVNLESLPISPQLRHFFGNNLKDAYEFAAQSGEEYKLLFTVSRNSIQTLTDLYERKFNEKLFVIGEMKKEKQIDFRVDGKRVHNLSGFNHFNKGIE